MRIPIIHALLLLVATSCLAQTFTTTTVDVFLDGCGAVEPQTVTLVPNGNEQGSFNLERIGVGHWRRTERPPFDARVQSASLRLGGARTGCETSHEMRDPRDANRWIAVFRFHCTQERRYWRELTIETQPSSVPMKYSRVMGDGRCVDSRGEIWGKATLADVAADRESIFLNLGDDDPKRLYTEYAVAILHGAFGKHALENAPIVVKRTEVLDDLIMRFANSGRISPANSLSMRKVFGFQIGNFDQMTLTPK